MSPRPQATSAAPPDPRAHRTLRADVDGLQFPSVIGPVPAALTGSLGTGRDLLLLAAGFGAGVVNGVAGGGTLVSFPTLLAMGYPALTANVTNTVGIWPGYIGGVTGFRSEIGDQRSHLVEMAPLSLLGAVVGSVLLLTTPPSDFARLVPWLVLGASALFACCSRSWPACSAGTSRPGPGVPCWWEGCSSPWYTAVTSVPASASCCWPCWG